VPVDRDNLDDAMSAVRPSVQFELGGAGGPLIRAEFDSIDDFHPDNLVKRVPLLRPIVELRGRVGDGDVVWPQSSSERDAEVARGERPAGGSLLDRILDDVAGPGPVTTRPAAPPPSELQAYIRSVVEPHLVAPDDPRQTALESQIDDTISSALRAILHDRRFQAVEALWRAVDLLVRRLETGAQLKVFVLDLSRDELAADLAPDRELEQTFLHRILVDEAASASRSAPWAVITGLYTFGDDAADVGLLSRLGQLAGRAGAPFLGAAAPALVGLDSFAAEPEVQDVQPSSDVAWSALRVSPQAQFIGLAQPRFLLRLPYDPREEPCETIEFDEMASPPVHDDYLWGNPAIACALLLGAAFERAGWQMRPGDVAELDGLPLHLYRSHGYTVSKPCAEALLTDRVGVRLMEAGPMPLLSEKDGAAVRVLRFQSIAQPAAPLAGPWR
jgi:type VI secretion system protein ImpC